LQALHETKLKFAHWMIVLNMQHNQAGIFGNSCWHTDKYSSVAFCI